MKLPVTFSRIYPRVAQQHSTEDPRGINPPFGKTHSHSVEEARSTLHDLRTNPFLNSLEAFLRMFLEGCFDNVSDLGIALHHSEHEV